MGHVRKDILNGWKEIGGYVCRDIRTVERWEKQRGLPVRRVPGAGRATVYALIPEVDEWLSRTKLNEDSADSVPIHVVSTSTSTPATPLAHTLQAAVDMQALTPEEPLSLAGTPETPENTSRPPEFIPQAPTPITGWRRAAGIFRGEIMARVAIAGSMALLGAVIWPLMVQARREKPADPTTLHNRSANVTGLPAGVPYRSRVSGVDELYLNGIYFYEQRTSDSLQRSLEDFNSAIARDPNYAPAYAGLANTYNLLRQYSQMPDSEAYPKAKVAAERAIALDPKLPQAHASLGFIDFFWSWNAQESEKEFRTALELDPNSSLAHHWYGSILAHEGRYAEAVEQLDVAQRLDPTSTAILSIRALAVGMNGRREEAVRSLEDVVRTSPPSAPPHQILATLSLLEPRDFPRFLDEAQITARLRNDLELQSILKAAQTTYRSHGERAAWTKILSEENRLHPGRQDRNYQMAQAEAALSQTDAALSDLMQLSERREPAVMGVLMDPTFQSLRSDPRLPKLLDVIGLHQQSLQIQAHH